MSRSLGLRDDQRVRKVLVLQIAGLFPLDPVRPFRPGFEQAQGPASLVPLRIEPLAPVFFHRGAARFQRISCLMPRKMMSAPQTRSMCFFCFA